MKLRAGRRVCITCGLALALLGGCGAETTGETSPNSPGYTSPPAVSPAPDQGADATVLDSEVSSEQLDELLPQLGFELDGSTPESPRSASGVNVWTASALPNLPDSDVCLVFEMTGGGPANLCHVIGVNSGLVSGAVGLDVKSDKRLVYFLVDESVKVSVGALGSECDLASVSLATSMLWSCVVTGSSPQLSFLGPDDRAFLLRSNL